MAIFFVIVIIMLSIPSFILLKKAWYGFHRDVGISHKPIQLITEQPIPPHNPLAIIDIPEYKLQILDKTIKEKLSAIDQKLTLFNRYQSEWKTQHEATINEDDFVLAKLINEHLPQAVDSAYKIVEHRKNVTQQPLDNNTNTNIEMLTDIINEIEAKIDTVLSIYEKRELDNLTVVKNYIKSRD